MANVLVVLKPEQRAVVTLYDIEGMSYREISEVLGTKLGTVCSRIARGRTQLHGTLAHRAPSGDHARYLEVSQEVRGNDCHRYKDNLPGFVDQILPECRVNQVSEHLARCPGCFAAVNKLRRACSRPNSCRAAAALPETLAEKLQGIAGNECDQLLYLTGDGSRRHSHGGRLIRGDMIATVALATLMMPSLVPTKEPAAVGNPVRMTRGQYSLALTTINVGQGVGAVQWVHEWGVKSDAAMQLSPRTFDLGQAVPINENNVMIRLGNNGQSITYPERQQVWLMDGDDVHRPNDMKVDVVVGEGATLMVLDGTGEHFLLWFVPTMGCYSSPAGTGWQFYTYQNSDTVAECNTSVVEVRGDGHPVAR